jgi:hypothetical protein
MINLHLAEVSFGLITTIIAYFIVVSISGYFRALIALKMGDNTPAHLGFLTLNPIKHTDFAGFIFLFLFGFGWGRYIQILSFNISGKCRNFKVFLANFADVLANILIAIIALIGLVMYFGADVLRMSLPMVILLTLKSIDYAGLFGLAKGIVAIKANLEIIFPQTSSFAISMVMVAIAVMYLSVLLAALNFIINGFWYVYTIFKNNSGSRAQGESFFILLIPMFLIFFLIEPLRIGVVKAIAYLVAILAKLIGFY